MKEPAAIPNQSRIRPFRSLSFRLPLIVAGSLLLMALVSAGISYFTTRDGLANIQEVNLRSQAGFQATAIERELREHVSRMENIANRQSFTTRLAEANDAYLGLATNDIDALINQQNALWAAAIENESLNEEIITQVTNAPLSQETLVPESTSINDALGITHNYLLIDSQGLIVATSQPGNLPPTFQQTETEWWQAVNSSGDVYISQRYTPMGMGDTVTIMDFALPITDENGNVSGVLYSSFDYNAIRSLIRQTQAADSGRTALALEDGSILFTNSTLSELSQATDLPLTAASESLTLYEGPENELFVITAEPIESQLDAIEQLGWFVAAIQPEADAFSPINAAINSGARGAAITGFILVLLLFFGYIRPLTSSLDTLRVSAQSLQSGTLDAQATVNRQDEIGVLATTFNQMADRLKFTIEEQESTIASRTADLQRRAAQLETVTLIGQAASASLDLKTLMADTVNLIRDKFGFYHASIFLIDDVQEFAVVRESTGEVGQIMKARPHKLAIGSNSIVGWVTKHHQPRIALNVGQDAVHFNNPLLPKTQSEAALPLISQSLLLGALDVQSTETNAFDDNDLAILQLMADQVAAAIYNARLYSAVQDQSKQRRQIIDLWQQLSTLRTTSEILETTCQDVYNKVGYDAVLAILVDGNEWHIEAGAANSKNLIPPKNITRPIGNGIIGQSIMLRRPIIQISSKDFSDHYDLDFPEVASRASAPIIVGNEIFGAIALYREQAEQLDENDLSLLEIVTTTVSSAISNAHLISETERNLEEINRLYRQTLQSESRSAALESVYNPTQHINNGKSNQVTIPLVSRGRQIGQIEIEDQENSWSEEEQILSGAIASQAALALENSAFFNQTQIRLKETEALFNLSITLGTTSDLSEVYKLAARTIADLLQVSRVAISSWNREENTIIDEADYIRDANNQIIDIFDEELIEFDLANHAGTTQVLNTLTPLIRQRSDPELEESEKELLIEYGLNLCLELPLVTGNEAIGIIELYREFETQTFSDYEIRLAQSMANQTATVIQNARLAAESQSRLAELSTLNRISDTLSLAPDLNSVFVAARQEIMGLINSTGLAISLLNESGDTLRWIYIYEHGKELEVDSLPQKSINEGFGGYVVRNGRSVMENRITPEIMTEYNSEILTGAFASSYMGLPLRVANETIGVLGIENNDTQDAFTQNDLQFMETIAGTIGIAIENQRLLEQTQDALLVQSQQSLQLQAATEVSAASSSILDTERLITTAVNLIQERFALYYVGLFLIDPATNEAWLRAGTGEAGRIQLKNQHRLPVGGQSLIGGTTEDGRPRIVQDVTENKEWRPNPILPETRSELALPMRVRDQIIGALTVQSTQPNEFVPEFVAVLQTMADQLAIAIENTRLLTQTQARANRQHILNEVSTQLHRSSDMNTIIGIGLQALSDHFDGAKVKLRLGQPPNEKNGAS